MKENKLMAVGKILKSDKVLELDYSQATLKLKALSESASLIDKCGYIYTVAKLFHELVLPRPVKSGKVNEVLSYKSFTPLLDLFYLYVSETAQVNDNSFEFIMPEMPENLDFKARDAFPKKSRQKYLNSIRKAKKELAEAVKLICEVSMVFLENNKSAEVVCKSFEIFCVARKKSWPDDFEINLDSTKIINVFDLALRNAIEANNARGFSKLLEVGDKLLGDSSGYLPLLKALKDLPLSEIARFELLRRLGGERLIGGEIQDKLKYLSRVLVDAWSLQHLNPVAEHLYGTISFWLGGEYGLALAEQAEQKVPFNPEIHELINTATVSPGELIQIVEPVVFLCKNTKREIFKKAKVEK